MLSRFIADFDLNQRLRRAIGLHIPMLECCNMLPIGLLYLDLHIFLHDCDARVPPRCCLDARLLKKLRNESLCKGDHGFMSHLTVHLTRTSYLFFQRPSSQKKPTFPKECAFVVPLRSSQQADTESVLF